MVDASHLPPPPPPPDPQFVLRGTQSAVHALHFHRGDEAQGHPFLFSGCQSGLVHIWSLQTRRPVAILDGHGGQCVTWLHMLPQGQQLLSQGRDLRLCLWDLEEGRNAIVDSVPLENVGFCRSSVLAEAQKPHWMLAIPGKGSDEVQILEMPSKTSVCTLKPEAGAKPGMPMCLGLWQADSGTRPLLLAGYEDGSVALWDVSERKAYSRIACHEEPVMGLDFDPQRARGVSGSAGKALAVWSLDGRALQVCHTQQLTNPGIADLTLRPDGKILATAGWDHRVRVFHWRKMKPLAVLTFHSATVHCVAFAADGLLAAGSKDQRISIWSLYPPKPCDSHPNT
ncbi:guanine nucleotide-binding protein subunit beta-like protein 1 [Ochotona princeps]|uniref:guanine nucleotide-binding protein subunit beta-like protein 1 n=1 Tax=Ochotona princeps TaxID=9978 RepID=UPI00271552A7|nr:guanine nucleotide-binding protein subunit beta-like protein 1 [Ochotona princeps]